ncbi:hypothetical protein DH2020_045177 [Rehmannia glutinosa]|uniref:Zinc finger PHD-type domain-containing protein n=1 Tax=Rehmannia glutinosa TaxID=99300 RepID=A0ABR0UEZ4_REHGL
MAKGGKIERKCKTRNKVRFEKGGSDESDEDYMVGEDDFNESEDEYCSSLADDETEESLGEFEEEGEWVNKKIKKDGRPRGRKSFRRKRNNGVVESRKKQAAHSEEEEEDYDDDDFTGTKRRKKSMLSHKEKEDNDVGHLYRQEEDDFGDEKPRKRTRVSSTEKYTGHCNEKSRKKTKVSYREEKEDGDYDDSDEDDDVEFTPDEVDGADDDEELPVTKKNKVDRSIVQQAQIANGRKGKRNAKALRRTKKRNKFQRETIDITGRKSNAPDSVSSGLSNYEYTMSEEEREQIREASEFCRKSTTSLRSSNSLKMIEEEAIVPSQRKPQERKGKEKVINMKIEVESRCPLCKQRFATISRTARADGGHDLKDAIIPVPERDQVYQPSEEELRGYLDPYENVLCTECHQGGDDAFMLLCDLCDSPAHTYCVGLGREVPEGSCNVRETFDLNELYVPDTPLPQVTGHSLSPRYSIGDFEASSPASGSGAFTLYDRRRIQRQINQLLSNRSRHSDRSDQVSGISLFGSQICRDGVMPAQRAVPVHVAPQNIFHQEDYQTTPRLRYMGEFFGNNVRTGQGFGHQQLRPSNSSRSNTGADAGISMYQFREVSLSSLEKEQVQSMVKSHLKSLSRNLDLGYNTFKDIARTSTHTILAAVGIEHRWNEVYPVRTRPLMCNHFDRLAVDGHIQLQVNARLVSTGSLGMW